MTASEMIIELKIAIQNHGDLEVFTRDSEYGYDEVTAIMKLGKEDFFEII